MDAKIVNDNYLRVLLSKRAEREYKDSLPHFVYFIKNEAGAIKIGITESLERRLKELQHGNSDELKIFCYISLPNRSVAYAFEFMFHDLFADFHMRGEWFNGDEIEKAINGELGRVICFEH